MVSDTSPFPPVDLSRERYDQLLDAAGIDGPTQVRLDAVRTSIADRVLQAVKDYGNGKTLDVGAGTCVLAMELQQHVASYTTLDYEIRSGSLDVRGNGHNLPFATSTFDTVIAIDVLEHVQHPWRMFEEFVRVLAPDGILILVTPFFFWAHEEPNDFFRISKYGLLNLCRENELQVLRMQPTCGFVASVGLLLTVAITRVLYRVPPVLSLALKISRAFQLSVLLWLDDHIDPSKRFAQGHLVVAKKVI